MESGSILNELRRDSNFTDNVTEWKVIPAREGSYCDLPENLSPRLKSALNRRGIQHLFSHQGECWERVQQKQNVVVVTPTASGKTLCYNLPVLNTLLEDRSARALYLFPAKALSQDQQSSLNEILQNGDLPLAVYTFDGDTPSSIRSKARKGGRIIISNPDMLHTGVLPNHTKWIEFFQNIRYIVLDELHVYTGVFGSHMANLMRRLLRVCRFYGSNPSVIASSATIGNPGKLAHTLFGRPFSVVDQNGAPQGERHLIFYNPPLVDHIQGIRRGVVLESRRLALKLLKAKVKTIVFARSRIHAELISGYINKSLENTYNENHHIRVESYRGGYLPSERRAIERGLRDGSIHGVVSTNALELGIDIGGLDASVLAGIPASAASAWQCAGRAGRSRELSLAIFIASSSPTDQYLVKHPEYFLGKSPESAYIDPENLYILADHIKCAAFELPFEDSEEFAGDPHDMLSFLEEQGVLRHTQGRWYWSERAYPSEQVSLRGGGDGNVVIVDTSGGAHIVIGEIDTHSARELLHDEAIYLHRGEQYVVRHLDLENHHAYVERSEVNYYTDALTKSDIKVLSEDHCRRIAGVDEHLGDLLVRTEVAKYKKLRFGTHENIGYGDVHLSEDEMHTRGVFLAFTPHSPSGEAWDTIPDDIKSTVINRLSTLIRVSAPLFLLSHPSDLGVADRVRDPHFGCGGMYIYDKYPGGIGLAEAIAGHFEKLIQTALDVLTDCPCLTGCPSCVGAADERDNFEVNPKEAAGAFLRNWIRLNAL